MIGVRELEFEGVFEITTDRHDDDRGFLSEIYNSAAFASAGIPTAFVQDNLSYSRFRGTLRGLHYQVPPRAQDKLIRVSHGSIYDVVVDLRRHSSSFGRWIGLKLFAAARTQIFIPKGFAHGFVTLEDHTEVIYKVSDHYSPEHDRAIRFDDPAIGIVWPDTSAAFRLSMKDRTAPHLSAADVFA